jgi:dTDP-glucose 4,6-dehydratase
VTTALVTGGAGFLGSHLCDLLLAREYHVVIIDNLDTGSLRNLDHLRGPEVEFLNADVVDPIELEGDVDVIFHLASPASPIDYLRLPLKTLKVDSWGTHNVLVLARRKRARFVLASTSEVYGDPLQHPQSEDYAGNVDPIGPRGVYDESKRYAEAVTMTYRRQQGLDTAIARIFNTYGPRMRSNDGRAVPTFVRQALQGKPLTVFGDGTQTRSFCYVTDLVDALLRLAESGAHEPINLGNPAEITLGELAETVTRLTESPSGVVYSALPPDDPRVRRPNIARARERLGWEPATTLEEGLGKMIAYERSNAPYIMTGLSGS